MTKGKIAVHRANPKLLNVTYYRLVHLEVKYLRRNLLADTI